MRKQEIQKRMRKYLHQPRTRRDGPRNRSPEPPPEHPGPCEVALANGRHPPLYDYLMFFADDFLRDFGPVHA